MDTKHIFQNEIKLIGLETLIIESLVSSRFCISWSEDDKIAIVIDEGIYIFELCPCSTNDHQTIALLKHCMPPSAFASIENSNFEKSKLLWHLQRKYAFELALDQTMTKAFKTPDSFKCSNVIQCEFSPLICHESYISCLTNDGSVEIFKKEFKSWISIINISHLWKSYCEIEINCQGVNAIDLKKNILQLTITAIKWFEFPQPTFVTAHKNGVICLWKVIKSQEKISMSVDTYIHANLQLPCKIEIVSFVEFNFTILLIGSLSGIVKGYSINLHSKKLNQEFDIWSNRDCIASDSIITASSRNNLLVLIIKRHVLLISKLERNDLNQMNCVKTKFITFPSAISSLIKWENYFLLSLINHNLYSLKIENSELKYNLTNIDLEFRDKHKSSYNCYGLSLSRNNAIWIIVSSAKLNYDLPKDITLITICTTNEKKYKLVKDFTSCGLIDKLAKKYDAVKLNDIFDFLELKRLELLSDDSKFKSKFDCNDKMSLFELKLLLWEARLKKHCNSADTDAYILALEMMIAKKHSKKILNKYQNMDNLKDIEKKSLKVHSNFLISFENKILKIHEKCIICGSEVIFENIRTSSCANNHKFPRCCISLLPCNQFPYAVCQKCDTVALIGFVSESQTHCLFCDGLLVLNSRFKLPAKPLKT